MNPLLVKNLESLVHIYDFFIIDIHGVIHNGIDAFYEATHCINTLINYKPVIFLSNNPRPSMTVRNKIRSFGISEKVKIYTSGDVVRHILLNKYYGKKLYHLGSNVNKEIISHISLECVDDIKQSDLVLLTLFLEDESEIFKYEDTMNQIALHNVPVICANPDKLAPHGEKTRICAGTIAEILEKRNVQVSYIGKPEKVIYNFLIQNEPEIKHIYNNQGKGLMIGDTLEIDGCFAKNSQLDFFLVLSGITGRAAGRVEEKFLSYLNKMIPPSMWPQYYALLLSW